MQTNTAEQTQYGYTCHFDRGYTVEITSKHKEWTQHAAKLLQSAPALVEALRRIERAYSSGATADGMIGIVRETLREIE